ncbi:hypothetical protein GCM10023190_05790 [Enteractinococcus fodinae]
MLVLALSSYSFEFWDTKPYVANSQKLVIKMTQCFSHLCIKMESEYDIGDYETP